MSQESVKHRVQRSALSNTQSSGVFRVQDNGQLATYLYCKPTAGNTLLDTSSFLDHSLKACPLHNIYSYGETVQRRKILGSKRIGSSSISWHVDTSKAALLYEVTSKKQKNTVKIVTCFSVQHTILSSNLA